MMAALPASSHRVSHSSSSPLSFLAFDFGTRCVGVASGNTVLGHATPLTEIRDTGDARMSAIAALVSTWAPDALVVGIPCHPDGTVHDITRLAERFARQLEARFRLPVVRVDERYSSVEAARDTRGKAGIDARSAAVILDQHLGTLT